MAFGKVMAACMISMLFLSASIHGGEAVPKDHKDCFCPCMRTSCIKIKGTTREDCADACDTGCRQAGYPARKGPDDFCGL